MEPTLKMDGDSKQPVLIEFKANRKLADSKTPLELAAKLMDSMRIPFDKTYDPVPMSPEEIDDVPDKAHYVLSALVGPKEIDRILNHQDVIAIWEDALIDVAGGLAPYWCPGRDTYARAKAESTGRPVEEFYLGRMPHQGRLEELAEIIRLREFWDLLGKDRSHPGRGIVVGIVDGGITATNRTRNPLGTIDNVIGGWPGQNNMGYPQWGCVSFDVNHHANAMARLVQAMAPECQLLDLRIAHSTMTNFGARVRDALRTYEWAINKSNPRCHILTNSWCAYQKSWGMGFESYSENMNHPFIRKTQDAIQSGIIVLFCAGNCGQYCPNGKCSITPDGTRHDHQLQDMNTGPGRSIWGANAHPAIITVGAVTKHGAYIGYSSQGPANVYWNWIPGDGIHNQIRDYQRIDKPDVSFYSAFSGGYYPSNEDDPNYVINSGTSSATALAAGIVAILKQARPDANQTAIKEALTATARNIFDSSTSIPGNIGSGVIQPISALEALTIRVPMR